ncbi:MAG: alpha/beta fold hydrolase [Acidobacteriaceae bacterium]
MRGLIALNCWAYEWVLSLYEDRLRFHYGDEMRFMFREQLTCASNKGLPSVAAVWRSVAVDTARLVGPTYVGRLTLVAMSTFAASALVLCFALGFCTLGNAGLIHVCAQEVRPSAQGSSSNASGRLVPISGGHKMFLECTGERHGAPTIILATGRGIGNYQGWSLVQSQVPPFARVCSYDPLGGGESEHTAGTHEVSDVVENMHDLFHSAQVPGPYILVGISLGGVLVRSYEQHYPSDVAGLVFVDSSHEEMEWRDAAISSTFDPNWNDPKFLRENGLLPPEQHLVWHDDVPLIVLERTDLPPCAAFPGLTQHQCDRINEAWHSFQVDLSKRSKFGQLRPIAGSGHAMQQQKPEAIAQAIHDVLDEVQLQKRASFGMRWCSSGFQAG